MIPGPRPLVSIIVPVYNVERYLDECLFSIRSQTFDQLEIIVVEDCSTDGSLKTLEPHLADPRVRLVRHERNGGLSAARNTGIDAATGDFLMFIDSDDAVAPTLVERCVRAAVQSQAEVVLFGFTSFVDGSQPVVSSDHPEGQDVEIMQVAGYFAYPHFAWLKFMRRDLLTTSGLRFPVGHYYEDWPFHWELGFSEVRMVRMYENGYYYRQRQDSITGSCDQKLFHIFSAHLLVSEVLLRHAADDEVRRLLANKILRGIWFVLTTIDEAHVRAAVVRAKRHFRETREVRQLAGVTLRSTLVKVLMSLPAPIATTCVRSLRRILAHLSPVRRRTSRPRKPVPMGAG